MTIPTFREVEDRVGLTLRESGGLLAMLLDLTPLRPSSAWGSATARATCSRVRSTPAPRAASRSS